MTVLRQDAVAVPHGDFAAELDIVDHPVRRQRGWLMRRLLAAADVVGLLCAYVVALVLAPSEVFPDKVSWWWEIALFVGSLPLWLLLFRIHGLYDRDEEHTDHSTVDDIVDVFQVVTLGTWSFLVLTSILGLPHPSLERLRRSSGSSQSCSCRSLRARRQGDRPSPARLHAERHHRRLRRGGAAARRQDRKHPEYGLRVAGFVDRDDRAAASAQRKEPGRSDRPTICPTSSARTASHRVVIAFSTDSHEQTLDVIRSLQDCNVQIDIVPRMFEVLGTERAAPHDRGHAARRVSRARGSRARRGSSSGRSISSLRRPSASSSSRPSFVARRRLIKLDSRGPVFFRQVRMGAGGRTFRVFKFRTMVADAEAGSARSRI